MPSRHAARAMTWRILTARSSMYFFEIAKEKQKDRKSWRWDSNPQPTDYKSVALPIELRQRRSYTGEKDF